jgi:hypothetical protein
MKPPLTGQTADGGHMLGDSVYMKQRRYEDTRARVVPELLMIEFAIILNRCIKPRGDSAGLKM